MAKSGMELALQMMGLGPVMEQIKGMAESGKADQIVAFLEKAPEIAVRLERIERQQEILIDALLRSGVISTTPPTTGPIRQLGNGVAASGVADGGCSITLWDDGRTSQ